MKKSLVILAHPDDEIFFAYHLYAKKESFEFVFLTNGVSSKLQGRIAPQQRTNEALSALMRSELVTATNDVHPLGQLGNLRDGFLDVDFASTHFEELEKIIRAGNFVKIYTTDFEGAHQDHDTCNLISRCLGDQFQIPVQVFGTYPAAKIPLAMFNVMPIHQKTKSQFKERMKVISLSLKLIKEYPSQRRTWMLLGPFLIIKLIFKMPLEPLSASNTQLEVIANPLYSRMKRRLAHEVYKNHSSFLVWYKEHKC